MDELRPVVDDAAKAAVAVLDLMPKLEEVETEVHEQLGRVHSYWSSIVAGTTPRDADFEVASDGIGPALYAFYEATSARIGPDRDE